MLRRGADTYDGEDGGKKAVDRHDLGQSHVTVTVTSIFFHHLVAVSNLAQCRTYRKLLKGQ